MLSSARFRPLPIAIGQLCHVSKSLIIPPNKTLVYSAKQALYKTEKTKHQKNQPNLVLYQGRDSMAAQMDLRA